MSIDWITVGAQIANFLVLVWLLKRFLYRPILDGIDAREAQIADRMQEALTAKSQAQSAETDYRAKLRDVQAGQADLGAAIRKEAEDKRDALLAAAHAQRQQEQADWQAQRDIQARKYTDDLQRAGASALLALTRKALTDLTGETLEVRMAQRLAVQIAPMLTELRQAAGEAQTALVLSRDPLSTGAEKQVCTALETVFKGITTKFATDPTQSPGLVLHIGGAQVGWTVDTYIDGLEQAMTVPQGQGALR